MRGTFLPKVMPGDRTESFPVVRMVLSVGEGKESQLNSDNVPATHRASGLHSSHSYWLLVLATLQSDSPVLSLAL